MSRKLPVHLDRKEIDALINSVRKDKHRLGMALMAYSGLRVSEMCELKVSDINLSRNFIKISGKGEKERLVPLSNSLQSLIEKYLSKNADKLSQNSLLIGNTRSAWFKIVKRYAKSSLGRSDIHPHTLRHSFATLLYEDGVQLEKISLLLGHEKLDTTMIYSHISLAQKRSAIHRIDTRKSRVVKFLLPKKHHNISINDYSDLIGRDNELVQLKEYIDKGISVIIFGQKGIGKSAIISKLDNVIYIDEYKKKLTLIRIILHDKDISDETYKESEKELKKLSTDQLISNIQSTIDKTVVIDDITELSKADRKTVSQLSEKVNLVTSSSRRSDIKLFKTFIELKPLKRVHARQILSEMIHMTDPKKKENLVDDILHNSGENLKEAEYIARKLQLGKSFTQFRIKGIIHLRAVAGLTYYKEVFS